MKAQIKTTVFSLFFFISAMLLSVQASNTNINPTSKDEINDLCSNKDVACYFVNDRVKSIHNITTGSYVSYFDNGEIEEIGYMKNNILVGEFVSFYPNGVVRREFNYNEIGKRDGLQNYYYESGAIQIQGVWKSGQKIGEVIRYEDNEILGDLFVTQFNSNK